MQPDAPPPTADRPPAADTPHARAAVLALWLIAAGGLALRAASLGYDAPLVLHPDEHLHVYQAMEWLWGEGGWTYNRRPWGLTLWQVPSWALGQAVGAPIGAPAAGPGWLDGSILPGQHAVHLAGRAMVATASAVAAVLLGDTVRRLVAATDRPRAWMWGLLAAAAWAFSPLAVAESRHIAPDAPAAFGVALCAWGTALATLRSSRRGAWLGWAACAMGAGMAAGMKYNAGFVALVPAVAIALDPVPLARRAIGLIALGTATLAVFLLHAPLLVLDLPSALEGMRLESSHYYTEGHFGHATPSATWTFALALSRGAAGWWLPATLLLAITALLPGRERRAAGEAAAARRVLAGIFVATVAYAALFARVRVDFLRNLVPLLPLLVVLAAAGASAAVRRLPRPVPPIAVGAVSGLLLAAGAPALVAQQQAWADARTEVLATSWIATELPAGSGLLVEWYGPQPPQPRFSVLATNTVATIHPDALTRSPPDFAALNSRQAAMADADADAAPRAAAIGDRLAPLPRVAVVCADPEGGVAGPDIVIYAVSDRARAWAVQRQAWRSGRCRWEPAQAP